MSVEGVLFIAHQYLDLYRMVSGKKLLAVLEEQRDYIFVPAQVVDEVHRQKVKVAASFLDEQLRKLESTNVPMPDHLLSATDGRAVTMREKLRETSEKIKDTKEELKKLTRDLLEQVSQSRDEVSKTLAGIFLNAVAHTEDELQRARIRRERGNPPGKNSDPLGDQLNWEQIVTQCESYRKLWIVTRDSDYATEQDGMMFLNAQLYRELATLHQSAPEVFCFNNILDAVTHFVSANRLRAKELPTATETEQIKTEQESLPPLGWLGNYDDANFLAIQNANRERETALLRAAMSQFTSDGIFPTRVSDADSDKDGS